MRIVKPASQCLIHSQAQINDSREHGRHEQTPRQGEDGVCCLRAVLSPVSGTSLFKLPNKAVSVRFRLRTVLEGWWLQASAVGPGFGTTLG